MEWPAVYIAAASAILTVDFLCAQWRVEQSIAVNRVGAAALVAGATSALYLPASIVGGAHPGIWWRPIILPSYWAAFLVCLAGRAVERFISAARS
jgi:hypothetical protein